MWTWSHRQIYIQDAEAAVFKSGQRMTSTRVPELWLACLFSFFLSFFLFIYLFIYLFIKKCFQILAFNNLLSLTDHYLLYIIFTSLFCTNFFLFLIFYIDFNLACNTIVLFYLLYLPDYAQVICWKYVTVILLFYLSFSCFFLVFFPTV